MDLVPEEPPEELSGCADDDAEPKFDAMDEIQWLRDELAAKEQELANKDREKAQALVESEGMTIVTPHGKIPNPALKVRDNARAEVARLCREFGLSPASRVGLQSSKKKGNAASAIESILKAKTA